MNNSLMGLIKWQKKLGNNSNSNSNSVSNTSSRRNSSVDFSDVFGGPPRCSGQDFYYNNNDDDDLDNDVNDGFRMGLTDNPVFGDQIGGRKRFESQDFYGDIFGGQQPLLTSSLSPLSNPSKFSLPGRISNTVYATSTSMNQSSKSSKRSLSRLRQTFRRISNYQPSSLSCQISIDIKESTCDSKFNSPEHEAELVKNSNDDTQFHFSIYKWPNKGVSIALSSRKRSPSISKERSNDIYIMENTKDDKTIKDDSFSASKRRMPSSTQVRGINVEECKLEGDIGDKNVLKSMSKELKSSRENAHFPKSLDATIVNTISKIKSSTRPLALLFGDNKEENEANKGVKENKRKEKKKQVLNDIFSIHPKVNKSKVHEAYQEAENEIDKSEVTAKVKDSVKMFNQETPSKVKSKNNDGVGSSHSWILKDKDTSKITVEGKNDEKISSTIDHDGMQAPSVSLVETWLESIEMVDAESYLFEEQQAVNGNSSTSEPKIESTKSSPNIIPDSIDDQMGKEDTKLATESHDETQIYERKVKQWSKGKEGNIRALLSTMQFVLWPNSGWKPIALVDIIEANAVKKSYQRALLCLHPDKLQQKGAAPHQKFIAERVFDILQEAWDQFNSLGLL